jgi:hypothetical protein
MEVPGADYLIPTMEEMQSSNTPALQENMESMISSLMSGQPPQGTVMNQMGGQAE